MTGQPQDAFDDGTAQERPQDQTQAQHAPDSPAVTQPPAPTQRPG